MRFEVKKIVFVVYTCDCKCTTARAITRVSTVVDRVKICTLHSQDLRPIASAISYTKQVKCMLQQELKGLFTSHARARAAWQARWRADRCCRLCGQLYLRICCTLLIFLQQRALLLLMYVHDPSCLHDGVASHLLVLLSSFAVFGSACSQSTVLQSAHRSVVCLRPRALSGASCECASPANC